MASMIRFFVIFSLISFLVGATNAQLSTFFYSRTCPRVQLIVRNTMRQAISKEPRMGASILRLFFHDCFVNGCDASILLDDTPTFTGEKNAFPNRNSARGYDVIDTIKTNVEASCNGAVSCADILALAAREAVFLGLNARDMTALSGAHTIGQARCTTFRDHIYNDTNINPTFATLRQATCPGPTSGTGDDNLAPLDIISSNRFDNGYFRGLVAKRGLLHSDQELFNGGSQDSLVRLYSFNFRAFANDFANAMVKMGNISPLTGSSGEIRKNCLRAGAHPMHQSELYICDNSRKTFVHVENLAFMV
ncbi:Peroxidase 52 [Bienertia sinuspersici]